MNLTEERLEAIVAFCLVALGAFALWGALRMPLGSLSLPGPGFMPRVLSIALTLVGAGILIRRLVVSARDPESITVIRVGHRDIAIAFLALCGAAAIFEPAGFLITSALYLFVMLRALSPLGWIASVIAAVGASIAAHLFFIELLQVPMPGGPFHF